MSEKYDLIFLMTKQQDNEAVVQSLVPFLKDDGILCTMQNGLPETAIAKIVGDMRVIGVYYCLGRNIGGTWNFTTHFRN